MEKFHILCALFSPVLLDENLNNRWCMLGVRTSLVQTAELTKMFEIRNTEDLTEEWLREKLGFFH